MKGCTNELLRKTLRRLFSCNRFFSVSLFFSITNVIVRFTVSFSFFRNFGRSLKRMPQSQNFSTNCIFLKVLEKLQKRWKQSLLYKRWATPCRSWWNRQILVENLSEDWVLTRVFVVRIWSTDFNCSTQAVE